MDEWPQVVMIPPDLLTDADFDLWEELRPQIVAALEAKINEGESNETRL